VNTTSPTQDRLESLKTTAAAAMTSLSSVSCTIDAALNRSTRGEQGL
jgi:hypothetical protein